MKGFSVKFNLADSEYFTALRLVTNAVCSIHEVDLDTLEDFKVCVTESALILKNCGFENVVVTFNGNDGVLCEVRGEGGKLKAGDNELSLALVSALVEDCKLQKSGDIIEKVTLKI